MSVRTSHSLLLLISGIHPIGLDHLVVTTQKLSVLKQQFILTHTVCLLRLRKMLGSALLPFQASSGQKSHRLKHYKSLWQGKRDLSRVPPHPSSAPAPWGHVTPLLTTHWLEVAT